MSTTLNWGIEPMTMGTQHLQQRPAEATLNSRLRELKEIARTLLSEIETLALSPATPSTSDLRLYDEVQRFETALIRQALARTGGSQTRAAKLLGVKLTTLNSKIKRYKISPFEGDSTADANFHNQETAA